MAERCDLCGSDGNEGGSFDDIKVEFGGDAFNIGACVYCAVGLLNSIMIEMPETERGPVFKDAMFYFVMNKIPKKG